MITSTTRRVVITGLGLVCPLGSSSTELWKALDSGTSGVSRLSMLPTEGLPVKYGAEAVAFNGKIGCFGELTPAQSKGIRKGLKVMCREIQMGIAAAQLALNDIGFEMGKHDPDRTGVLFGSDYLLTVPEEFSAGVRHCRNEAGTFQFSRWASAGIERLAPLWLLKYLPNMPASHVAIFNDFRGPNNSITQREASSNLAVGEAFRIIQRGHADMMLAGATGTRVHLMKTIHAMQTEQLAVVGGDNPAGASRPFDKMRSGVVLGEGAAAIVLEELNSALARGATIHGEILGMGSSVMLERNRVPQRETALKNAIHMAMREAGVQPGELGHVHAHGLSTQSCDVAESQALHLALGDAAANTPVVAAKSYFGNLGAASGMVELISSLISMQKGHLFPILNYQTPDPDCPVRAVTDKATPAGDCFLNLSVTPQGQASSVLIRSYKE